MSEKFLERIGDQANPAVWVDSWAYCRALLSGGEQLDWNDGSAVNDFFRKSDSLIKSNVLSIPLHDFLEHAILRIPGLKAQMGEKSRTGYALKSLLRDDEVRRQLNQALKVIAEAVPNKPLVLSLPCPRFYVQWAYETAHDKSPAEITVDHADSGSVYLSDFITSLSGASLSGVLIEEICSDADSWREERDIYVPLRNVTKHQHWSLGVRLGFVSTDAEEQFDFLITPGKAAGLSGCWLTEEYWAGEAQNPEGDFIYGGIPANSQPEQVLEQRKALGGYSA